MGYHSLHGIYAAAVTPLTAQGSPDLEGVAQLVSWLAGRGCHGVLLMGTTGEGPSFSREERLAVFSAAVGTRSAHPELKLLAGTGTPSLEESVTLTRLAFDLGMDGVVVLPPYYFRTASDAGLFDWFAHLIRSAVPTDGYLLGYHIPKVSGVSLSIPLLHRLKDAFPDQFAGLKDSSGELEHAQALGTAFGKDLLIMNGTDRLLTPALQAGASGAITALANLISPELRQVWDMHLLGHIDYTAQGRLNTARAVWEKYPPAAAFLKQLLAEEYGFPLWPVKPPLLSFTPEMASLASLAWRTRGQIA